MMSQRGSLRVQGLTVQMGPSCPPDPLHPTTQLSGALPLLWTLLWLPHLYHEPLGLMAPVTSEACGQSRIFYAYPTLVVLPAPSLCSSALIPLPHPSPGTPHTVGAQ